MPKNPASRVPHKHRDADTGAGGAQSTAPPPALISATSLSGVTGVWLMRTPNGARASSIAEMTAAAAGIVLTSPAPLAPSGLRGDGVSLKSVSIGGTSVALGSR